MLILILTTVALLAITAVGFYLSAFHRPAYWRRKGIPGPPTRPFSGNMHSWWNNNIINLLREWTPIYGKTYGIQEGAFQVLVTSDIDMLQELFVKKFEKFHARKTAPLIGDVDKEPLVHVFNARGARWKRLRAIANPAFSVANLKKIMPIVNDSASITLSHLGKDGEEGEKVLNVHFYFQELTMDVIARVAMGQRGSRQFENAYTDLVRKIFGRPTTNPFMYYSFMFPRFASVLRKVAMWTAAARKDPFTEMRSMVIETVRQRKKERDERLQRGETLPETRDFIDFFLEIESEEAYAHTKTVGMQAFDRASSKITRELTIDEVVAMCMVFLLAGFDTTANTLALTAYYLMKNPEVQEKLRAEIDEVCGVEGGEGGEWPSYEQLGRLRYAEACMKETLRLVPIAGFASSRLCTETTTLGEYTVEAGTYVQADVFACQRDPAVWGEEVEQFRPERMLDEERRPLLSWFPFGAGPRTCVGMRLAYLEEKSMLVHLLSKYRLVECEETELRLRGNAILSPEKVMVKLVPRDKFNE